MDGVNFSSETVWEGKIKKGLNYDYFKNKVGFQYITEATDLKEIDNEKYDFILSCHSLEHVANPLLALYEWKRILKPNGDFILILPFKENTFDKNRPYTTFNHLLDDYKNMINETDNTHFEEIITLHESSKHIGFTSEEAFRDLIYNNMTNRCAHHHVFSTEVVKEMLNYVGFKIIEQEILPPFHLATYAQLL